MPSSSGIEEKRSKALDVCLERTHRATGLFPFRVLSRDASRISTQDPITIMTQRDRNEHARADPYTTCSPELHRVHRPYLLCLGEHLLSDEFTCQTSSTDQTRSARRKGTIRCGCRRDRYRLVARHRIVRNRSQSALVRTMHPSRILTFACGTSPRGPRFVAELRRLSPEASVTRARIET